MPEIEIPVTEMVPIDDLKVDGKNPNRMTPAQGRALDESIKKYGFIVPIITNKDLLIADGEQKWLRAKALRMKKVPVIKLPLEEVDRRILRQVLNKLRGTHDRELDYEEYRAILAAQGDLSELSSLLAVTERESMALIEAFEKGIKEDEFDVAKAYEEAGIEIKPGDVFQLEDHRLMCGDATSREQVKELMQGQRARVCFTDPPYNIGYAYDKYDDGRKKKWDNIFNDSKTEAEYKEFLIKAFENIKTWTVEKSVCFMWSGDRFLHTLIAAAMAKEYKVNQLCVWVKNHFQWSPSTIYHKASEYCTVLFKDGHRPEFVNKNYVADKDNIFKLDIEDFESLFDVWYERRDSIASYIHPTQKPVRLAERALRATTMPEDIVLDLFAGSGSTLIACDQMKRKAFLMELDPKYCDVIIKRWEQFTGKTAKKAAEVKGDAEKNQKGN